MMNALFHGKLGTDGPSRQFTASAEAGDQQSSGAPVSPGHDDDDNQSS